MRPLELAAAHFGPTIIRGDEIKPVLCPFCNGGDRHDKYTFAMNLKTGAYNCMRGSCGVQGSFRELCDHFGEPYEPTEEARRQYELRRPPAQVYRKPQTKLADPAEKVRAYLATRGISAATMQKRGVRESEGNIVFPYTENGELVLLKFRPARAVAKGERKMWREEGGKAVFWGMDACKPTLPLVVVEGEIDALTLEECGIPNVVSVPSGAEDLTCVDNCWEWLQGFRKVIIWPDNDKPGLEMCRKLIQRLGAWRCSVVSAEPKDANDLLIKSGKKAVVDAFMAAAEVPISGLVRLADVKAFDHESVVRVRSSIPAINAVVGGYMAGQVSIWTGSSGSGKSTFLGQELLAAVNQGHRVCAYSGELPAAVFRYWIDLQAAGRGFLESREDEVRKVAGNQDYVVYYPRPDVLPRIHDWYRNLFFLHDALGATTEETLLEVFTYAAMRYGCRVFLVDNLMTTTFAGSERDFYRKQSDFVGKMVEFAHKHECHVHVVAHPRKVEGKLSRLDVSGSGDITNRADNVFSLYRQPTSEQKPGDPAAQLLVLKNRFSGRQDAVVRLDFLADCRRFYMHGKGDGWTPGWRRPDEAPDLESSLGRPVEDPREASR